MWLAWLGGIVSSAFDACVRTPLGPGKWGQGDENTGAILLRSDTWHSVFGFLTFSSRSALCIQIVGLIVFYLGAATYNLTLLVAGKHLRPAPSGLHDDHRLVSRGPFRLIRHPLYVSYILIVVGLSLILLSLWLLIPALCLVVGIHPTAKAEEETLIEQFGEEYLEYRQRVGMFVPKLL
jgi:protein-S-isoprenylcysteine O-methyltransferase Ste14